MKRTIAIAALAAIAACSKPEPTPEATSEAPMEASAEASAAPAGETLAADGKPSIGTFKVTRKDGTTYTAETNADGTYAVTGTDGKVMETGKWEQKSPAEYCETSDKEGAKQKCFAEKVDDKGVYTSTDPENGEVSTIVRVEG